MHMSSSRAILRSVKLWKSLKKSLIQGLLNEKLQPFDPLCTILPSVWLIIWHSLTTTIQDPRL